jgi:hypothetical protein
MVFRRPVCCTVHKPSSAGLPVSTTSAILGSATMLRGSYSGWSSSRSLLSLESRRRTSVKLQIKPVLENWAVSLTRNHQVRTALILASCLHSASAHNRFGMAQIKQSILDAKSWLVGRHLLTIRQQTPKVIFDQVLSDSVEGIDEGIYLANARNRSA